MLINLASDAVPKRVDVDICIIGAGPAGISIAAEFAGSSRSVALLEAGFLDFDDATQKLNFGFARGPVVRHNPFYLATSRYRVFGGSQIGWGGWCTPLLPLDLECRDWVEDSGWPISMPQLIPYYERAAAICGVHESIAHPLPEEPAMGRGLTARRYCFAPGRSTAGEVFRDRLTAAENVSVYLGANVTSMDCGESEGRVEEVRARTLDGKELTVSARFFILAAGGIENARLLLANNLGNEHDLVGRFFMEHPHVLLGSVRLPHRSNWEPYLPHMSPEFGHGAMCALAAPAGTQRARRMLNATVQLWADGEPSDDIFTGRLLARVEQSPNPESRVTLGEDCDALGLPTAQLDWELKTSDWESVCDMAELVRSELEAHAGARIDLTISRDAPWPGLPPNPEHYKPWGCHHSGTTRMSRDARTGVVDVDTRVHGMDNLYVAGSSVFPTEGYANPTLTLIALALRTADHLKGVL